MRFSDHPGTRFTRRAATRSGRPRAVLRGERLEPRALLAVTIADLAQSGEEGGHGGGCGCNFCRSVGVGSRDREDAQACIQGTVAGYEFCALPPLRVTLSNASFGRIGTASATGTVLNDDALPARLSAATFAAAIGEGVTNPRPGKARAR